LTEGCCQAQLTADRRVMCRCSAERRACVWRITASSGDLLCGRCHWTDVCNSSTRWTARMYHWVQ